jgi:hypothetical protein
VWQGPGIYFQTQNGLVYGPFHNLNTSPPHQRSFCFSVSECPNCTSLRAEYPLPWPGTQNRHGDSSIVLQGSFQYRIVLLPALSQSQNPPMLRTQHSTHFSTLLLMPPTISIPSYLLCIPLHPLQLQEEACHSQNCLPRPRQCSRSLVRTPHD